MPLLLLGNTATLSFLIQVIGRQLHRPFGQQENILHQI